MKIIKGNLIAAKSKIAIVVSRFNEFISKQLLDGALDGLEKSGVAETNICIVHVPGAMEIPIAIKSLIESKNYDAIIAIGVVIRGATSHYDHVSNFAVQKSSELSLEYSIPVANAILTVENIDQAIERSGSKSGNKGYDAALTCVEMIHVLKQIK
jgi:6,7-dimethyl-8-ribityllumazine synthase